MLPDIFISTVKDIRVSKKTMVRHYCNAYAAIRELNALTKISKSNSVELAEKIALDDCLIAPGIRIPENPFLTLPFSLTIKMKMAFA